MKRPFYFVRRKTIHYVGNGWAGPLRTRLGCPGNFKSFQHHFPQQKNFLIIWRISQKLLFGQISKESIKLIFGVRIERNISNRRSGLAIGRVRSVQCIFKGLIMSLCFMVYMFLFNFLRNELILGSKIPYTHVVMAKF